METKDLFDDMDDFTTPDETPVVEGLPTADAFDVSSEVVEPVKEFSSQTSKESLQTKQSTVPAVIDFNNFDFGVNGTSVIVADTGTKVSRFPIERIKFTANKKERISIITDKVVIVKTHYVEDVGSIICNGSLCCEECGLPSVRYVFPIVHYEGTDKKGSLVTSDISVKCLAVGKDNYEELLTIMENKGSLTQFDLVVTCSDETYQKCSFTEAGPARWRSSRKAMETVASTLKKHGKDLILCLGRVVNDVQLAKLLGKDTAPGFAATDVDMDAIFKD